ncbi:MAG: hypothetical protein DU481_15430 [Nitrosomonas sp.]|uniref:DUF1413 domain-containing protein n=1 Tax=Nitrosomonas sp. TaxID=42353 RepID=UPI0032EB862B
MDNLNDNNLAGNIKIVTPEQHDYSHIIRYIQIHDGTWVEERFYDQILQLIKKTVPDLGFEQVYTAKKLCGKEFWDTLEKSERILAGKCVVDMVRKGRVRLRSVGTNGANLALYEFSK